MSDYNRKYWYTSSSGGIEFQLTWEQATLGSHSGDCEADVRSMLDAPNIKEGLDLAGPDLIRSELDEYGCWNEEELKDDEMNRVRLVWLACGDVADDPENLRDQGLEAEEVGLPVKPGRSLP